MLNLRPKNPLAAAAAGGAVVANTAALGGEAVGVGLAGVPSASAVVGGSPAPVASAGSIADLPAVTPGATVVLGAEPAGTGVEVSEAGVAGLNLGDILLADGGAGAAERVLGAVADLRHVGDVAHLLLGELHDTEAAALGLKSSQVGGEGVGGKEADEREDHRGLHFDGLG